MKIPQIDNIIRLTIYEELPPQKLIKAIEKEIADMQPYSHHEDNVQRACGVSMPDEIAIKAKDKSVSQIVEQVELSLTKRQLAVVYVGAMLTLQKMEMGATPFDREESGPDNKSEMMKRMAGSLPSVDDLSPEELMQIISVLTKAKKRNGN